MDAINNYLVFTSLFSFSIYMIVGSFRQIKQEVIELSIMKNKNERGTQTDVIPVERSEVAEPEVNIPLVVITSEATISLNATEEKEPSIKSNFTCISSGNKFKNLFKF